MAKLVIEKGPDRGRVIDLDKETTLVAGRDADCSIPLRDTMTSRKHFRIEPRGDDFHLVDLESMNGTLLNGETVREKKLEYGDMIKAGETNFSFLTDKQVASSMVGQRMGGYRILERVGRGGMGTGRGLCGARAAVRDERRGGLLGFGAFVDC